jgi:hypothetical protein
MTWFSRRAGQNSLTEVIRTFLIGSDQEAQQILKDHSSILLSDEGLRRAKEAGPTVLQELGMQPRIEEKISRRLALLDQASSFGLQAALAENEKENERTDLIVSNYLMTDDDEVASLLLQSPPFRDVLTSLRVLEYMKWVVDKEGARLGPAWVTRSRNRARLAQEARGHR